MPSAISFKLKIQYFNQIFRLFISYSILHIMFCFQQNRDVVNECNTHVLFCDVSQKWLCHETVMDNVQLPVMALQLSPCELIRELAEMLALAQNLNGLGLMPLTEEEALVEMHRFQQNCFDAIILLGYPTYLTNAPLSLNMHVYPYSISSVNDIAQNYPSVLLYEWGQH